MFGCCPVISGRVWWLSGGFWPCLVTCVVISVHVWLLSSDFWLFLLTMGRILAVFGYCLVIFGRVWLLFGGFGPRLVIVW